ncbi:MAG: pyridoxamine kinase [Eubacteriales bacterium]|nr:pyridoxamine kinase [Eubacteriales bacterium]
MERKKNTQVLLISDMAGYGKVALSAMIPVLSHLKFETFNLPTALVSNTLDYGCFEILDTTEYMKNSIQVWKKLSFSFDAICTGFIVSEQQSSLVYEYCKEQRETGTLIFVDPIMGDDGKRYNGLTDQAVTYMRRLCSIADVIVPNITEACFLSEYAVKSTYSEEEVEAIANRLHEMGAKAVVITSANVNGKMFTVVKNSMKEPCVFIPYEEIPVRFPGTGDIFVSIVMGYYMKSGQLSESVKIAMRQLEKLIRANKDNRDKYKGIPVEQFLEEMNDEKDNGSKGS